VVADRHSTKDFGSSSNIYMAPYDRYALLGAAGSQRYLLEN
jgi:hypothetical protein